MSLRTGIDKDTASGFSELGVLTVLDEVANRCARAGTHYEACLSAIVDAAIFVTAADKGNLQLLDPWTGCLVIRAQRGFDQPFLDFFSYVHDESDATCSAALSQVKRVIVEDVAASEMFTGKPAADVLLKEEVRAVQSTPLRSTAGHVVGMLSTHFTHATHLGERELSFMDVLARQAADFLERRQVEARFSP